MMRTAFSLHRSLANRARHGIVDSSRHVTERTRREISIVPKKATVFQMERESRSFRSSASSMLPVRRRRKGGSRTLVEKESLEDTDDQTTLQRMHSPVTDPVEFGLSSSRLLDKIEAAMEPMKETNETFVTKRSDGEVGEIFSIDMGPKVGIFQIEMSLDERVFEYSSPVSGKLLYCLSSTTGEWINMEDGHQFEGILVRDLLRSNCIGLPDL